MGAALTYARRYTLFTLAGIAGEDDLDAPDLPISIADTDATHRTIATGTIRTDGGSKVGNGSAVPAAGNGTGRKRPLSSQSSLSDEESRTARDKLVQEITALETADAALAWAIRRIRVKGLLAAADASLVERAFQHRIRVLAPETYPESSPRESASPFGPSLQQPASTSSDQDGPSAANDDNPSNQGDSSELAADADLVKLRRSRDKDHLRFIANQSCTVCGRQPCEAHHIRYAQPRALGRRVSDEFTVPLCRVHHRELHRQGDERVWWTKINIDPLPIALRFWQHTRGIPNDRQASPELQHSAPGQPGTSP
jgi:hypothetical protein